MGITSGLGKIGSFGARGGWAVLSKFKIFLYFFFFGILLINAFIIGFETGNPIEGVKYIGNRMVLSTVELSEQAQGIVERGGLYDSNDRFFLKVWTVIKTLYSVSEAFFMMYFWIKIFSMFAMYIVISDNSKPTASFITGLLIYLALQTITIQAFIIYQLINGVMYTVKDATLQSLSPVMVFVHLFRAIPYLVKPVVKIAEVVVPGGNATLQ